MNINLMKSFNKSIQFVLETSNKNAPFYCTRFHQLTLISLTKQNKQYILCTNEPLKVILFDNQMLLDLK